jgi:hypothetical protein
MLDDGHLAPLLSNAQVCRTSRPSPATIPRDQRKIMQKIFPQKKRTNLSQFSSVARRQGLLGTATIWGIKGISWGFKVDL